MEEVENQKSRCQNGTLIFDEIAKELNMSKRNLQRSLRIERNFTDLMKDLCAKAAEIRENFLAKAECGKN